MTAQLPQRALIILVGPSGAGKSTWARERFERFEILEADRFRAMVADDAADQAATPDAFKVLHAVARARLRRGLRTVIDATNLTVGARRTLLRLAARHDRAAVAVLFDVSLERCLANNEHRSDRQVPVDVIERHQRQLRETAAAVRGEGFASIITIRDADLAIVG